VVSAAAQERGRVVVSAAEVELPRTRTSAGQARRWLEQQVPAGIAATRTLDDLKLVVTELVENALTHGKGRIVLRLEKRPGVMRVEVCDEGENAAIKIRSHGTEIGGWGLVLVDRLSDRWGAFEGTTHVWAELPTATAG
jgi:anti-sigma regulatory factor (Ser/Thr protein kinase)